MRFLLGFVWISYIHGKNSLFIHLPHGLYLYTLFCRKNKNLFMYQTKTRSTQHTSFSREKKIKHIERFIGAARIICKNF